MKTKTKPKTTSRFAKVYRQINTAISIFFTVFVLSVVLGVLPAPYDSNQVNYAEKYLKSQTAMLEFYKELDGIDALIKKAKQESFIVDTVSITDTIFITNDSLQSVVISKHKKRIRVLEQQLAAIQSSQNETAIACSQEPKQKINKFSGTERTLTEGMFSNEGIEDDLNAIGEYFDF